MMKKKREIFFKRSAETIEYLKTRSDTLADVLVNLMKYSHNQTTTICRITAGKRDTSSYHNVLIV